MTAPTRKISRTDPYEMFFMVPTKDGQYKVQGKQLYKIKQDQQQLNWERQSRQEVQDKWKSVSVPGEASGSSSDLSKGAWRIGPPPKMATEKADEEEVTHGLLPLKEKVFIYDDWNGVGQPGPEWIACQEQGYWMHMERQLYYNDILRKYSKIDEKTQTQYELDPFHTPQVEADILCHTESSAYGLGSSDPSCATTKTVLIKDLISVGQALKTPLDFLDRPASMFAIFAKAGDGMECVDFCSKNLHTKLLKMFKTYHGHWDNVRVHYMIRAAFQELESDFVKKNPEGAQKQGCSVGVCLLLGSRLFVAAVGACRAVSFIARPNDTQCEAMSLVTVGDYVRESDVVPNATSSTASGTSVSGNIEDSDEKKHIPEEEKIEVEKEEMVEARYKQAEEMVENQLQQLKKRQTEVQDQEEGKADKTHEVDHPTASVADPEPEVMDVSEGDASSSNAYAGNKLTTDRVIGCLACLATSEKVNPKAESEDAQHSGPEPSFVLHNIEPHSYKMQIVVLVVGERVVTLSQEETFEPAFRFLKGQHGFPKAICGAVSQKAGEGPSQALSFAMSFLTSDRIEDDPSTPKAKRQKTELSEYSQVRVRHILLRFVGCRIPAELATKLKKKATRTREDAENQARELLLELMAKPALFPQRARELSECNSALKNGPAAGDLGWIGRNQRVEKQIEDAAFALEKDEFGDVVISEAGCHIIQRIA